LFLLVNEIRDACLLDRGLKKGKHFEINKAQRIIARSTIAIPEHVTEQLEQGSKE
jgi:hypothetical protein